MHPKITQFMCKHFDGEGKGHVTLFDIAFPLGIIYLLGSMAGFVVKEWIRMGHIGTIDIPAEEAIMGMLSPMNLPYGVATIVLLYIIGLVTGNVLIKVFSIRVIECGRDKS